MIKHIIVILISFILLSLLSCGNTVRRTKFYTPKGNYDGYAVCDMYGCAFYDRNGVYEGFERFNKSGE